MKHAAKALIRDSQGKILVLQRSETHPHLAHDIDLPGGEIEDGELVEIGLAREVAEETGLSLLFTPEDRKHAWQSLFGAEYSLYEVSTSTDNQIVISWEHESYMWMTEEELVAHEAIDAFMHRAQEWLSAQEGLRKGQT
jgi:8-oxo-dGTP pyrophosphatase MutT (NUDIX family)